MIRDFEDNVILDVLVDVFLPCGRYTESLMLMSLLEVCQEWGVKMGDMWRMLRFLVSRLEEEGHPQRH